MKKMIKPFILIFIIAVVLSGCSSTNIDQNSAGTFPSASTSESPAESSANIGNPALQPETNTLSAGTAAIPAKTAGLLKVHFIDVGQGDSELIQTPDNKTMLIDAGTNASTNTLIKYLKSQRVNTINYLILTHPHEDHIGGADAVLNDFNVEKVYMPKVTANTKTFEDVLNAMKSKGLKASQPEPGISFKLGEANCTVLGPANPNPDDFNTYSIVLKLTYGKSSFLFTGDSQASNEEDMLSKGVDLASDVLKVAHHGSHTSTSQNFLDAVNPGFAVISCGKGNDYGHPHEETMEKLEAKKIPVYRTDECGTIIAVSDGKNISFNVKPGDYNNGDSTSSISSKADVIKPPTPPAALGATETEISATVDNKSPAQNSSIELTVIGPKNALYTAVCHFKSKDTTYSGKVGSPLNIEISRASKGYKVVIDITINYNGKTYTAKTSFTPQ